MDFGISLLIFIFTLVFYYGYTNNLQNQGSGNINSMLSDVQSVSSSLASAGYPNGWDSLNVVRIGLADEQKLNISKLKLFRQLNYSKTKSMFGIFYDYFVFFADDNNEVLNVNGICGIGDTSVTAKYAAQSAYYYSSEPDSFLKRFMNQSFGADIYFGDDGLDLYDIDGLISNISKYKLVVFEQPDLQLSAYNSLKPKIENFTSSGNSVAISGQLISTNDKNLLGSDFRKKAGQAQSDRQASVNATDDYLSLEIGNNITFAQAYYIDNTSSSVNFSQISLFRQDSRNAISKWNYGNGTVYFFSSMDASYLNSNFAEIASDAASQLSADTCTEINLSNANLKDLVKAERYVNYKGDVVKMVVYLWQ